MGRTSKHRAPGHSARARDRHHHQIRAPMARRSRPTGRESTVPWRLLMSVSILRPSNARRSSADPHLVLGYAGRRIQLMPRQLAEPCSASPFLDLDHVLDVVATLTVDTDGSRMDSVFNRDRDQLLTTLHEAHAVFLSPGGGLLAYKSGTPRKWRVLHVRSGADLDYFAAPSLDDPRPWTRIGRGMGMT